MDFLILVVLGLGIIFTAKKHPPLESLMLTRACTDQLKAVAILLVILGHLTVDNRISILPSMLYAGGQGVTIFLFLSGFGLAKSYVKAGLGRDFVTKRLNTISFPYMLVSLAWLLIDALGIHKYYSVKTMLLTLLGFDPFRTVDPTMWYISFILMWCFFFYIIFKLPLHNLLKLLLLLFASYLVDNYHFPEYTQTLSYNWSLYAYVFPMGVALALYSGVWGKLVSPRLEKVLLGTVAAGFLWLYVHIPVQNDGVYSLVSSNLMFAGFVTILVVMAGSYGYHSRLLTFLGSLSYELYLFEGIFIWKYSLFKLGLPEPLGLISYFMVIIGLSMLLKPIVGQLIRIKFELPWTFGSVNTRRQERQPSI